MNGTCKLIAVALTTVASISLDVGGRSTLDSQLYTAREDMKLSSESIGACNGQGEGSSGSGKSYDVAEAYDVYSAIIPTVDSNPETKTWFIRIDTLPISGSLDDQARKSWKQTRGADIALDDYYKVNRKTWLLQRKLTLPNPYKLVTREQLKAMFPHDFRGGSFGELWLELSAVGFNANKTVAVVYMNHICTTSCCCAEGNSFVLEKHNSKWKVSSKTGCWIS